MNPDTLVRTTTAKNCLLHIQDHLPDASENLVEFCQHLAGYIGEETTPFGFALDYCLLLDDLKKGVDGRTGAPMYGRTVRAGDVIYRALSFWAVGLARVCFGQEFSEEVSRELTAPHVQGAVT